MIRNVGDNSQCGARDHTKQKDRTGTVKHSFAKDKFMRSRWKWRYTMEKPYNVLLCLHLPRSVVNWGPLWARSAFVLYDAKLLDMIKNTQGVALQIVKTFWLQNTFYCQERCLQCMLSLKFRSLKRPQTIYIFGLET